MDPVSALGESFGFAFCFSLSILTHHDLHPSVSGAFGCFFWCWVAGLVFVLPAQLEKVILILGLSSSSERGCHSKGSEVLISCEPTRAPHSVTGIKIVYF